MNVPRKERLLMRYGDTALRVLIVLMLVLIFSLSAGCSAMKPRTAGEWAFHTANAMDMLQTINHGSDPCYVETNHVTRSILGDNPGTGESIAFFLAVSAVHRAISWELQEQNVPNWIQRSWEAITFGPKAYVVYDNHQNGVRMFGDNETIDGCTR